MSDSTEDLIREIAAKHGIAVARDDPILVLQTINNRLLLDSAKAQQEQLDAYKQEMEALANRWSLDAKDKAERVLNASLTAGNEAAAKIIMKSEQTAAKIVQSEIDAALARIAIPVGDAHRIALANMTASFVTVIAAALSLWTILSG